jgi:hypothetical protein
LILDDQLQTLHQLGHRPLLTIHLLHFKRGFLFQLLTISLNLAILTFNS